MFVHDVDPDKKRFDIQSFGQSTTDTQWTRKGKARGTGWPWETDAHCDASKNGVMRLEARFVASSPFPMSFFGVLHRIVLHRWITSWTLAASWTPWTLRCLFILSCFPKTLIPWQCDPIWDREWIPDWKCQLFRQKRRERFNSRESYGIELKPCAFLLVPVLTCRNTTQELSVSFMKNLLDSKISPALSMAALFQNMKWELSLWESYLINSTL